MGILTSLAQPVMASNGWSPWDDRWYGPVVPPTSSGMAVSAESSMRISAVWACVGLISDTIASLPLPLYERDGVDRTIASTRPLYRLLHDRPNPEQTAFEARQYITVSALLRGNGYALLVGDAEPEEMWPLHPDAVRPEYEWVRPRPTLPPVQRIRRYLLRQNDGGQVAVLPDQMLHLRGMSHTNGLEGVSVIEYARQGLGLSLATEEHGARLFGNGGRPTGVLSPTGPLSPENLKRVSASWKEEMTGPQNAGKTAVLPVDLKYTPLAMSNEDSQFLETREYQVRDIVRWFRVPLHMIGETTKETSWGSGIENQFLGWLMTGLRPWLVRWEQAISRDMILDVSRYFAEHIVEGLLRGDSAARAAFFQTLRQNGVINAETWARKENLPIPDGDAGQVYWRPANMSDANAEPEPPPPEPSEPPPPPPGQPPAAPPPDRNAHHALLLEDAAARVVRKEVAALGKVAQRSPSAEAWQQAVTDFYAEHASFVAQTLRVPESRAWVYAMETGEEVRARGAAILEEWEARPAERVAAVVRIALGGNP